jgi:hypothetical protein
MSEHGNASVYGTALPDVRRSRQGSTFDLIERARSRATAIHREMAAVRESYAEGPPRKGPVP